MNKHHPYQPLLLRVLHGFNGVFLIAAIVTAAWTYDTYDGRWGRVPLPYFPAIEGIHGTFGLYTLLIFPAFVFYAFHRGHKRLVQPDSWAKLTQLGKPVWWYTLNRFTNTLSLLALTFALFSGKMMSETWLPKGELNHGWYSAHLISWIVMVAAIALHLLMNAKVGGAPLLLSMLVGDFFEKDSPRLWPRHLLNWGTYLQSTAWLSWLYGTSTLMIVEKMIFLSLLAAWVIPLFK